MIYNKIIPFKSVMLIHFCCFNRRGKKLFTWTHLATSDQRRCFVGWLLGAAGGSAGTAGDRDPAWASLEIAVVQ